ncbi:MAG: hypothetical protein K0S53_1847 [Bacteroidetes bacterium]|jgi:hypothetical protein|nr:hypothetical protein [Bacteroidota bacterium]
MKISYNKSLLISLPVSLLLAATSCKKESAEPIALTFPIEEPAYEVPTSYNFTGVDFSTSTNRILMLGEITTHIRSAHTTTQTSQPTLNAQKLKDMYANAASQFTTTTALNSLNYNLKAKMSNLYNLQTDMDTYFDEAANTSTFSALNPTANTASVGVAGKIVVGTRAYLVNANGYEYKEVVEKGIMGAVFYSEGTTLLTNIASFDNTTIANGTTAQERAWDEAFGYFGVPTTFPTYTVGLKNWGSYCNSVSNALDAPSVNSSTSLNVTIMNAFLKGRAAISNKDAAGRDAAKAIVLNSWEKVGAGRFITYMKLAKTNITDAAQFSHLISEGIGFVKAFKYNPSKTLTASEIATLEGYFGTSVYSMDPANIDLAIDLLAAKFGLDKNKL